MVLILFSTQDAATAINLCKGAGEIDDLKVIQTLHSETDDELQAYLDIPIKLTSDLQVKDKEIPPEA